MQILAHVRRLATRGAVIGSIPLVKEITDLAHVILLVFTKTNVMILLVCASFPVVHVLVLATYSADCFGHKNVMLLAGIGETAVRTLI